MRRAVKTNKQGQILGRKGLETRQRLLEAARVALRGDGEAITVARIAEQAGTAPPTFYLYFEDVDDAICALAEQASEDLADLPAYVRRSWPVAKLKERSRTLVNSYFRIMGSNREVMSYRNAQADCGNPRFVAARLHGAWPLIEALAEKMISFDPQRDPEKALAQAAVVITSMERLAARIAPAVNEPGISDENLIEAEAEILARLMAPGSVPIETSQSAPAAEVASSSRSRLGRAKRATSG